MEKRVLLAVFLSFLVLYVYQTLLEPPPVPQAVADRQATPSAAAPTQSLPVPNAVSEALRRRPEEIAPVDRPAPEPLVADTVARDIVVDSDFFRATFTNRGGELISWQLKEYLKDGTPVELVPRDLPPEEPWPFSLAFDDETLTFLAHEGLYQPSLPRLQLTDRAARLTFEYEDASGLHVRKTFAFDPGLQPYFVTVTIEASLDNQPLNPTIRWGPALGGVEAAVGGFQTPRQGPQGVLYGRVLTDGVLDEPNLEHILAADAVRRSTYEGQLAFLGVDNHYFVAAALPMSRETTVSYRPVPLPPSDSNGQSRDLMAFDLFLPEGVTELPFFLGPKDFDVLEAADPMLVRAIDFGWLSWLIVPLHRSLKWIHGSVGNWGWSIIILTILINVVIFPLRHKSVVSMRKMQELQPEMKAIQERYKNLKATDPDKQKMNQEIMGLYRDRGVNPASGCLPMLLTMPILFAFYRLLSAAIELRGAPFMLWIDDLSSPDPLYVTPIVMGASMVLQQKMTPSQADPTQQKIMMIMPVVFTFMFLGFPSGLVLYWLTSNVFGIGQQMATNRIIGAPKVRVIRPAAERQVKQVGKTKGKDKRSGR